MKTFHQNIGIFQQKNETLIQDYYTTNIDKIKQQIEENINSIKYQEIALNKIEASNKSNNEIKSILKKRVSFNNITDVKLIEQNQKKNEVKQEKPILNPSSIEYKHNQNEIKKQNIYIQGIQRIQSTCYINTAIQTILDISEFSNFLMENKFKYKDTPLLIELKTLYIHCRTHKDSINRSVSNKNIIECLKNKKIYINPKEQNDSTEFLETLISKTQEELNSLLNNNLCKNIPDIEKLTNTFIIESSICQKCNNERFNDQSHLMINLKSDGSQNETTIDEKLKETFSEHNEKVFCTKCKTMTQKLNKYNFGLSNYLFIKISRNKWNNYIKKLERAYTRIHPNKILNIKQEHNPITTEFGLTGGITHIGNGNTGHYKYITKINNIWYEINDSQTNSMTENEAIDQLEQNGILITYKINKDSTNQITQDTKEIQKSHELIKHKKVSNNIKLSNKMPNWNKTDAFIQPIQAGRQSRIKNTYRRINYAKETYRKIYIKKPNNSYFDPDRNCFYIRKK